MKLFIWRTIHEPTQENQLYVAMGIDLEDAFKAIRERFEHVSEYYRTPQGKEDIDRIITKLRDIEPEISLNRKALLL